MKSLLEYLSIQLQKTHIFEMAYSRKKYMDVLDGLKRQLLENWILIRYCTLSNKRETKEHWQDELYIHLDNLQDMTLKIKDKQGASKEVLIDWAEYNKENKIHNLLHQKLKKEDIDINNKYIIQACGDWCKYGIYEIINIISMKSSAENIEYMYDYVYEKI